MRCESPSDEWRYLLKGLRQRESPALMIIIWLQQQTDDVQTVTRVLGHSHWLLVELASRAFFFLTITVISSVVVRSEKKWNLRCATRLTSDQNDPFQNTYSISLGKETFRVSKKGSNAAQLSSRHPIMEPNKGNNIMCNERRLRGFRIGFPFDRLKKKTMPFKHVAGRRLWKQIVVTHTDQINDITVQSSATVTVKWGHSR